MLYPVRVAVLQRSDKHFSDKIVTFIYFLSSIIRLISVSEAMSTAEVQHGLPDFKVGCRTS